LSNADFSGSKDRIYKISPKDMHALGEKFDNVPAIDVYDHSNSVSLSHDSNVTKSTSVEVVVDMFFQGIHRVFIVDEKGELLSVLSQSDFLFLLSQSITMIDVNDRSKTIQELGIAEKDLLTVNKDTKVISVLAKMAQAPKRPISAVPIVNDNGDLIATFSSTNLLSLNRTNFHSLSLPVIEFMYFIKKENEAKQLHTQYCSKYLNPITCTLDSTFQSVVMIMSTNQVHRVWVVNNEKKLIGVVASSDLFKVFVPWAYTTP